MDVIREFLGKTDGFLEKLATILEKMNNIYNEPQVIREK